MNEFATVKVRVSDFERCNADLDRLEDENERLKAENAKLCELVTAQKLLVDAVHAYWADGMNQEQFNVLMKATARVDRLRDELGIEVDA